MDNLTQSQKDTLNKAFAIIDSITPPKSSWVILGGRYTDIFSLSVTYFDIGGGQHQLWRHDCTVADKFQMALDVMANANGQKEAAKRARVERLQRELAALTEDEA